MTNETIKIEKIKILSLIEYRNKLTISCDCGFDLSEGRIDFYDHEGGDFVEGYKVKQWISIHCHKCDYDWSMWKVIKRQKAQ